MNIGLVLVLLFSIALVDGRVRYNSQIALPYGLLTPDLTGDGVAEFVVPHGDKIFITTTEYCAHGIVYTKLGGPITRLFYGKFTGGPKDVLCAQMSSINTISCYSMDPSNTQLWWWWNQNDFIGTNQVIVGDYDGNGMDDILLYNSAAGTFQVHRVNYPSSVGFGAMPNWNPGNLGSGGLINYRVLAGNFGTVDSRTDLLLWNPTTKGAYIYIASIDGNSQYTMWWWFSTANNWILSDEEVSVADMNGDVTEEVVCHNYLTGTYRPFTMVPGYPNFPFTMGNLPTAAGYLYWTSLKNIPSENGGLTNKRDDSMLFMTAANQWVITIARYDGSKQTYWWAFTQFILRLDQDPDGDGIITEHELGGYDPNNDGVSNVPLHTYGASPLCGDIFVHLDYMAGPPGQTWNYSLAPNAISYAVADFAKNGYNLHVFQGSQVPYQHQMFLDGNVDWTQVFDPIKKTYFPTDRQWFFHYGVMGDAANMAREYWTCGGISRGVPHSDFMIAAYSQTYKQDWTYQLGGFMHVLGHNLGLTHGGVDNVNYKPNYFSIMNSLFYASGFSQQNAGYQYSYNTFPCLPLNENALNENAGVTCNNGGKIYLSLRLSSTSPDKWPPGLE